MKISQKQIDEMLDTCISLWMRGEYLPDKQKDRFNDILEQMSEEKYFNKRTFQFKKRFAPPEMSSIHPIYFVIVAGQIGKIKQARHPQVLKQWKAVIEIENGLDFATHILGRPLLK